MIDKTTIVEKENDAWFHTEATIETTAGERYMTAVDVMASLPGLEQKREGVTKKVMAILGRYVKLVVRG